MAVAPSRITTRVSLHDIVVILVPRFSQNRMIKIVEISAIITPPITVMPRSRPALKRKLNTMNNFLIHLSPVREIGSVGAEEKSEEEISIWKSAAEIMHLEN